MAITIKQFFYLDRHEDVVDVESFTYSCYRDWHSLQDSIARFGILTPVLVRRNGSGWALISGKGRWLSSTQPKIPAMEMECSDRDTVDVYVQDNSGRGFNPVECARVLDCLHHKFGEPLDPLRIHYSPLLRLPDGLRIVEDHLAILRLPQAVLEKIARGLIPIRNALMLLDFNAAEAELLAQLSERLRWSVSAQKDIFTMLWELSRRASCEVAGLLENPCLQQALQPRKGVNNGEEFYRALKKLKMPRLLEAESAFQKVLTSLRSGYPVEITPSPYFEKEQLHVTFQVKDAASFTRALTALQKLQDTGAVEQLIKICHCCEE